jgi:hypothetical protein
VPRRKAKHQEIPEQSRGFDASDEGEMWTQVYCALEPVLFLHQAAKAGYAVTMMKKQEHLDPQMEVWLPLNHS